jgi:hypothetical protein
MRPQDVARIDEMRGSGVSRSGFVRELLRRAAPIDDAPSYSEALMLLAQSAREGRVQAQVALERALRSVEAEADDGWLSRLLDGRE